MHQLFKPLISKQNQLRTERDNLKKLLDAELASHAQAQQMLSGVQENLTNCLARIRDLEEANCELGLENDLLRNYAQAVAEAKTHRQKIPLWAEFQAQHVASEDKEEVNS